MLVVACVGVYFGFTKHVPFTHGFRVKAVFAVGELDPPELAGAHRGRQRRQGHEDRAASQGSDAAVVTMEIDDKGLPIHKDATMKIRPRIFLEGNFFVDLPPGTPSAPTIDDGDTHPGHARRPTPVQLDQVLTALQSDTRTACRRRSTALRHGADLQADAGAGRRRRPRRRAARAPRESLNDAIRYGQRALKGTAIVTDAFLGTAAPRPLAPGRRPEPHDRGPRAQRGAAQGPRHQLQHDGGGDGLAGQRTCAPSIRLLGPTLRERRRARSTASTPSFPNTRAFAREILPGVRETAATIDAAFPWIAQTRALARPRRAAGRSRDELQPGDERPRQGHRRERSKLLPQADLVAKCVTHVVLPTGDVKIDDGALSSDEENYKEFWYTMVGLAGEGQNFDGNGMYVRFQPGGGDQTVSTGGTVGGTNDARSSPTRSPSRSARAPPSRASARRTSPTSPATPDQLPDLNGAATGAPDGSVAPARATPAAAASSAAGLVPFGPERTR